MNRRRIHIYYPGNPFGGYEEPNTKEVFSSQNFGQIVIAKTNELLLLTKPRWDPRFRNKPGIPARIQG
jgi:hypothetical protein